MPYAGQHVIFLDTEYLEKKIGVRIVSCEFKCSEMLFECSLNLCN